MQMNLPFAHKNVTKYPVSRAVYHDIYSNNKKFNGTCEKKRNKSIEFLIYLLFVPFLLFSDKKKRHLRYFTWKSAFLKKI